MKCYSCLELGRNTPPHHRSGSSQYSQVTCVLAQGEVLHYEVFEIALIQFPQATVTYALVGVLICLCCNIIVDVVGGCGVQFDPLALLLDLLLPDSAVGRVLYCD